MIANGRLKNQVIGSSKSLIKMGLKPNRIEKAQSTKQSLIVLFCLLYSGKLDNHQVLKIGFLLY
ncbi:hypothetical protein NFHkm12_02180 [Latilactobacillus curvatus]|uniref:Transposase n=1 Tax=Latilactobacillus curvatus TaxID=28038 RepID=A0ABM7QUV8_LATCU|nr:hypothetical protein NFHkm12_02180 [Latilactobacillus curvatus]BCX30778.1 hypothetical protein LTWDN19_13450 [Latilactobacillus curvatus]